MAASVLTTVPVVVLYTYLQRYMVEGLTAGAVKRASNITQAIRK